MSVPAASERTAGVSLPDVSKETLTLTAAVYEAMISLALGETPDEACGLFAGPPGGLVVDTFFPIANVAPPERRPEIYKLDGRGMLDAETAADEAGRAVQGVMHSHTHTVAYPSPTDVADAADADPFGTLVFVIVSLEHPDPYLRAFRILDGDITDVPVAVDPG